jgi:muconolactone delta-isomerase
MQYLVTMTTHVPDGTPDQAVTDIRAREAAHSSELAAQGHLLRLWRPPLQPGEWRSLGLFAAADDTELEQVLASMPLRVWRTDEVTPLAPHPNDPDLPARNGAAEFLTFFTTVVPDGTPAETVRDTEAREAVRAKELAEQGHLLRLWRLPGEGRALGLWVAADRTELEAALESLPLDAWMTEEITPLTPHPSDPGGMAPFIIGTEVRCRDGVCGEVSRVVVDPVAEAVTHLVVEPKHHHGPGRLVPLALVEAGTGDIRLRCTLAEFGKLDRAEQTHLIQGTFAGYEPGQVGFWPFFGLGEGVVVASSMETDSNPRTVTEDTVPLGEADIRRGDHVDATDGTIGLQEGHLWGHKEVAIPTSAVASTSNGIQLTITKQEVRDLPSVNIDHPHWD